MAKRLTVSQYDYYAQKEYNPSLIDLGDKLAWSSHVGKRRNLYHNHLGIPFNLLLDRSVLELGCNSGENALVLAFFGANLTLVEPNGQVLPRLKTLFNHFGLEDRIAALCQQDVESFESDERYDIVVAEGFMNTLSSRDEMLKKLCSLASPGGLVVFSFDDRIGHFVELTRKLVLARACYLEGTGDIYGNTSLELAKTLFAQDFSLINASRPFEVYWQASLTSPFLDTQYLWSYEEILPVIAEAKCEFSSSSPSWHSSDQFAWYKNISNSTARHQTLLDELTATFPFFLTGIRPTTPAVTPATPDVIASVVDLISDLSNYVADTSGSLESLRYPHQLHEYLSRSGDSRILSFNKEMRSLYETIHTPQTSELISAYHRSAVVRKLWGTPNHYLCIRTPDELD